MHSMKLTRSVVKEVLQQDTSNSSYPSSFKPWSSMFKHDDIVKGLPTLLPNSCNNLSLLNRLCISHKKQVWCIRNQSSSILTMSDQKKRIDLWRLHWHVLEETEFWALITLCPVLLGELFSFIGKLLVMWKSVLSSVEVTFREKKIN